MTTLANLTLSLSVLTDGDDIIIGPSGNDIIQGDLGNDLLISGSGDDVMHAGRIDFKHSDGDLDFTPLQNFDLSLPVQHILVSSKTHVSNFSQILASKILIYPQPIKE